jgi:hypothetical protein
MSLCDYADILGRPREGIHSWHILGVAVVDVGLTVALTKAIQYRYKTSFGGTLIAVTVVAELFHYVIGVDTNVMRFAGLTPLCK